MKDCEICGNTRHVRCGKVFERCVCIEKELKRRKVAKYTTSVVPDTEGGLVERRKESLLLVGSMKEHTPYIAGVYQDSPTNFTINTLHAYDMVSAFFGETKSGDRGLTTFVTPDLLIVLLGFTELTNKMLGDMLQHVYASRTLKDKATWFAVPNARFDIAKMFGDKLDVEISGMAHVSVGRS